jgi:hypothetical protein
MIISGKAVIAGDWHGNARWAVHVINEASRQLDEPGVFLQLGDFGLWRSNPEFRDEVNEALTDNEGELYFIDGNHEDHVYLAELAGDSKEPVQVREHIWYLPRGFRWEWHGRTWLALGGAASVDRAFRTEGQSWFPEEEITLVQAGQVVSQGTADVMLTHECPRSVTRFLPLGHPMAGWDMKPSRLHQELLDRIVGDIKPSYLFHGHMHVAHQGTFTYPYGKLQVRGLDCDGRRENWTILDTATMEEVPE